MAEQHHTKLLTHSVSLSLCLSLPPPPPSLSLVPLSENDIMCMETTVHVGRIEPHHSQSASMHFLALREGLLAINNLYMCDERNQLYRLDDCPHVFSINNTA
jgi:hypothetical protein